jgi:hypothetical protein
MSADDKPTDDDKQREDELKEALNYLFGGTEFEIKSGNKTMSSDEVTDQVMEILEKRGMIPSKKKGGSRTRSKKSKGRRTRSSKKKRSTRRRR